MAHPQFTSNLPHGEVLDLIEVLHLVYPGWIHGTPFRACMEELTGGAPTRPSRLLSPLSVSTGRKRPCANPFQPYLVFYHLHRLVRDEDNELLERLFGG